MATASDLIRQAMIKAGVLFINEAPTATEENDALETLNAIIESMSNDNLFIYASTLENFTLTSGQATYTIGSGGDFNTTRPIVINTAYVRSGTIDYPINIIDDDSYAAIPYKAAQGIPQSLNYRAEYPLGKINLYFVPSSAYVLYLLSEKPVSSLTLSTTISLPPGYSRYLVNQLGYELGPMFGQEVPGSVAQVAAEAYAKLTMAAARVKTMDSNPGAAAYYFNPYAGYYG